MCTHMYVVCEENVYFIQLKENVHFIQLKTFNWKSFHWNFF